MYQSFDEDAVRETYIQWLYSLVGLEQRKYNHYWRVIRRLFKREYYYLVDNDINRYEDGMDLRDKFCMIYNYPTKVFNHAVDIPCTVLEMLVAFAIRIDQEIMWNPDVGNQAGKWFWQMIFNLGIDPVEYSDEHFDQHCLVKLEEKLDTALGRKYRKDGEGSFFPMKNPIPKNFQKVELWYQMQFWMEENFPI